MSRVQINISDVNTLKNFTSRIKNNYLPNQDTSTLPKCK